MDIILVFGVAGSGKSTQSQLLADELGLIWLSMGQIIRDELTSGPLADHINSGKLLDDEMVKGLIIKNIDKVPTGKSIVLDGFPRRISQAKWLQDYFRSRSMVIKVAVHLAADYNIVTERLLKRGRTDDVPNAIKERFYEYENEIKPILEFLQSENVPVLEFDAEQPINVVHNDIVSGLKKVANRL
ncbi:MAG: nucleoside monophosphate kinase [Patescibacteria group bacterium]|jgi:adenylate kinase|nr:nucleoside monophosphate kinase [Patescibacteria group bacterium]